MRNFQTIIGIDVAQDSLSISIFDGKSHQIKEFNYTKREIRKELITPFKKIKGSVVFVMESTGIYHTRLAYWLCEEGFNISVVNPLIIKRYGQMHLMRIKTDKADAKMIAEYGYEYQHKISLFRAKDESQIAIDNLIKAADDLFSTAVSRIRQPVESMFNWLIEINIGINSVYRYLVDSTNT